jgi:hypothetical protein
VFIVTVCGCFVANNTMVGWARDLVDIALTPEIARQTELKCAGLRLQYFEVSRINVISDTNSSVFTMQRKLKVTRPRN